MIKGNMATRTSTAEASLAGCTEFVLHKSQQTIFSGIQGKIIDYTEHKLVKYAINTKDAQQQLVLMAMISDYMSGKIAIAWKRGKPVPLRVTSST